MNSFEIKQGDSLNVLRGMQDKSVHCCITSPPYWGLRDYGTGNKQIGLEATPQDYVRKITEVFSEVKRVLRDDGTLWLNLGDTYSSARDSKSIPDTPRNGDEGTAVGFAANRNPANLAIAGLKHKDLVGVPWRVALALQEDGWYLRQDIIWHKPNPMPESVTDRCTKAHEYIFLLSKSARYYFDAAAIAEPLAQSSVGRLSQPNIYQQVRSDRVPGKTNGTMKAVARKAFTPDQAGGGSNVIGHSGHYRADGSPQNYLLSGKRNKRSVWTVTTKPYKEAHFATFPPDLIAPCVLAGCPKDGTILDPFGGSGTTAQVAIENGRNAILIELNPEYIRIANDRLNALHYPLFVEANQ